MLNTDLLRSSKFLSSASSLNIQIQAFPSTVTLLENDVVIVCSIANPSQINAVYFMTLYKNASTTFSKVVSVALGQPTSVQWGNTENLQSRATATGTLDSPSTAELRFKIDKSRVECPTDFKTYICQLSGNSVNAGPVTQNSSQLTLPYTGMHIMQ